MSVKEPSASVPTPSSIAPAQEGAPFPSNSLGDAPTIDPTPGKKTAGQKKTSKKRVANVQPVEPVDAPATPRVRDRYDPYQKATVIPGPEGNLPAHPEELETLDATAKMIYKSDREVLEYIEALKHRTAAMLEHVNRNGSQLRSYKGAMERINLFVGQWQKIDDRWTHQQLFGDGNFRAKWEDGKMRVLDSDESSDEEEEDTPNPRSFPTLTRNENGAFPTAEEHLSKNLDHPNFPYDYARDVLGKSAPQPPNDDNGEEDFFRPETPPARQPSLPPGHEDENGLEYAEDEIEMRSDFPVPPDHAALASDDSTFDRSGADLRITSDTGTLFPLSDEELARISEGFRREAMDPAAALATQSYTNPPRLRHPLAQSYVPSSSPGLAPQPECQHLVAPLPVPRTPSPSRPVLGGKRKRVSTPEEEDNDVRNNAGPSTVAVYPYAGALRQVDARNNEDRVSPKKRRLVTHQSTWDPQLFVEVGCNPVLPRADPPSRENSPEPSSQPAHKRASPPSNATSQIQKEDSELENSQVIELLSRGVEQGESEDDEGSTGNILGEPQPSLPALTPENTQATTTNNTQSEAETPAESQVPAKVPASIPEDVFGPIVLSAKANKISDKFPPEVFEKDTGGDVVMSDSEHETANVSSKSTRFSLNGGVEKKEHKVFRKTPIRPRTSWRAMDVEYALAAQVETESQDAFKPLPSPKKKRGIGARVRKPKAAPSAVETEPTIDPENGLPSISTSKPPSRLRRGRSASVQPEFPALPKTPVRKSTRNRK